jgi:predicted metalloprotease with PDZ domain
MTTTLLVLLAGILALSAVAAPARAQASTARVEYVIDLANPQTQTVDITLNIRGWPSDTLEVHLPVWRPGRYEVLDPAGTIRSISAKGNNSTPLAIEKYAKSSWRIATGNSGVVSVKYTVFANAVNNRTRHVDDTHAFLSGSSVFLYVHELRNNPIEIAVKAPDGWKIASGLEPTPGLPNILTAPDYDTLVDSPLEIGIHDTITYTVDGVPHDIVFWGGSPSNPEPFLRDFAKFTKVQKDLFGSFPYKRYVFITHIGSGMRGGTEHLNSTIIQATPAIFDDPDRFSSFLGLASHELFHTWNVKQFRPEGLKPYDYSRENYTKLLWVAEGCTNYYDSVSLVRAGILKPENYLAQFAGVVKGELTRPGRALQSLEASSFDAWIKFNKATPDSVNSTVSFYSKGEVLNFTLDAELRRLSRNAKSLDDVMRILYERFPLSGPAYTTADLLSIYKELTGADFTEFHAKYIAGTEDPDVDAAFAVFGLELTRGTSSTGSLGLDVKNNDDGLLVSAVRTDGPAYLAGVNADDVITAINGEKLNESKLNELLAAASADTELTLTISRRGKDRAIAIRVQEVPSGDWSLSHVSSPTPEQRAAYEHWLRASWPAPKSPESPAPTDPAPGNAPDTRPSRF